MSCSIKDCESNADIVFCPNRFTFKEMYTIGVALHLAPGIVESFMESVEDYEDLTESEKHMYDEGPEFIRNMEKIEKKVHRLTDEIILLNEEKPKKT